MKYLDITYIYDKYEQIEKADETDKKLLLGDIAREINDAYRSQKTYIDSMARIWDENIHFVEGNQHLYFNEVTNRFEKQDTNKFNKYIPRPVTNYIMPIKQTMVSILTKNKPQASVMENSDTAVDINKAKLSDILLDAKWEMDNEGEKMAIVSDMAVQIGTVYRKDYWDTTGFASVEGAEGKKIPMGETAVSVLSPFEVIPDTQNAIRDIDDGNFVLEATVHPVQYVKDTYDSEGEGYTGLAKEVCEDKNISMTLQYLQRLKSSTGQEVADDNGQLDNHVVKIEAYIRPTRKYKKGLMIIVAGEKVLYLDKCKYTYDNGENWHPYTMFRYQRHPFRHHGMSLVEHLVPVQKRINAIDALIILNRMTNASPQWKVPIGCLTPGFYISGQPNLMIPYKPGIGNGPEKIPGAALDSSVYRERSEAVTNLHMIAGDNEVLQGQKPAGVNTASGLNILLEQSFSKFSPLIQDWERFIEKCQTKKLNLCRKFYKEPRNDLVRRMKAINKENTRVMIDDYFTGKTLGDNIQVRVEAGSSLPRSKVVEQSKLQELAGLGVFGQLDPLTNPIGNREFLRKFGITDFPTVSSKDTDRAKWENDCMRQKKFDEVEVRPTDNPVIHFSVVLEEYNKAEFSKVNPPEVVQAFIMHGLEHFLMMEETQYQMASLNKRQVEKLMEMAQMVGMIPPGPTKQELMQQNQQLQATVGQMQQAMDSVMQQATAGQTGGAMTPQAPMEAGGGLDISPEGALNY